MRIIGGDKRGLRLAPVGKGDTSAHLRPTSDRVRESLFNILMGGRFDIPVSGARVLDMFCGTGALGLEALSRGADTVTFVDDGQKALSLVRQNIDLCRCSKSAQVLRRNATRLGDCTTAPHDLIFLDPPYGKKLGEKALASALDGSWIAQNAWVVWEENGTPDIPPEFQQRDQRRYGDSFVTFLERSPS